MFIFSRHKNCYDISGRKKILHPSFTVNQEKRKNVTIVCNTVTNYQLDIANEQKKTLKMQSIQDNNHFFTSNTIKKNRKIIKKQKKLYEKYAENA